MLEFQQQQPTKSALVKQQSIPDIDNWVTAGSYTHLTLPTNREGLKRVAALKVKIISVTFRRVIRT
ncbi:hypothetical protein B9J91_13730, partial [Vibrio sp. V18_P1S4T112]